MVHLLPCSFSCYSLALWPPILFATLPSPTIRTASWETCNTLSKQARKIWFKTGAEYFGVGCYIYNIYIMCVCVCRGREIKDTHTSCTWSWSGLTTTKPSNTRSSLHRVCSITRKANLKHTAEQGGRARGGGRKRKEPGRNLCFLLLKTLSAVAAVWSLTNGTCWAPALSHAPKMLLWHLCLSKRWLGILLPEWLETIQAAPTKCATYYGWRNREDAVTQAWICTAGLAGGSWKIPRFSTNHAEYLHQELSVWDRRTVLEEVQIINSLFS